MNAPYADRCPECLGPIVTPHASLTDGDQLTGRYRCPDCRHTWVCRWSVRAVEGPVGEVARRAGAA